MKKFQNLGRSLTKDEQKKLLGGAWSCSCSGGQPGSWYYENTPTVPQMIADINTYCSSGGSCHQE